MNKTHVNICEKLGWSVRTYQEQDYYTNKVIKYVSLSQHSPAGEDFSFDVEDRDFVNNVKEYAADFDEDEHVELWIPNRGQRGVPSSISVLVEDAKAIFSMLENLADALIEAEAKLQARRKRRGK